MLRSSSAVRSRLSAFSNIQAANKKLNSNFKSNKVTARFYSESSSKTLLIVEHNNKNVLPPTFSAATAAKELGGNITALVIGSPEGAKTVAEEAGRIDGVSDVMHVGSDTLERPIAELYTPVVVTAQEELNYSHIIAPHSVFGKNLLPRIAAKLDVSAVSDIIKVESSDTFVRPIYAGNALAKVKTSDAVKLVSVRSTAFPKAELLDKPATVAARDVPQQLNTELSQFVSEELSQSDRPDLETAPIVISGGRGLKSGENFKLLYDLASKLNAAVGASRAAVDAGYVPNDMQVGQTGKVVAPELYIAVGISGAIQHLAGMKDSKCIVAINKDGEAPIFQVADYGLVGDLFKVVPELTEKVPQL